MTIEHWSLLYPERSTPIYCKLYKLLESHELFNSRLTLRLIICLAVAYTLPITLHNVIYVSPCRMKAQAALLLLLSAAVAVHCYSTGAPSQACTDIYPEGHTGPSLDCSTSPFQLSLSDFDETYGGEFYYVPQESYTCEYQQ